LVDLDQVVQANTRKPIEKNISVVTVSLRNHYERYPTVGDTLEPAAFAATARRDAEQNLTFPGVGGGLGLIEAPG